LPDEKPGAWGQTPRLFAGGLNPPSDGLLIVLREVDMGWIGHLLGCRENLNRDQTSVGVVVENGSRGVFITLDHPVAVPEDDDQRIRFDVVCDLHDLGLQYLLILPVL